jgi:rubrerythrin
MFTLSDIIDVAVQIEENGQMAYAGASTCCEDPNLCKMLETMAHDEQNHTRWFQDLKTCIPNESVASRHVAEMGRSVLQDMLSGQTFSLHKDLLISTSTARDLIVQSIEFENDTILFYQMLSQFIDDSEVLDQLDKIISEEQRHVEMLEQWLAEI